MFLVDEILSPTTIRLYEKWKWKRGSGDKVVITDFKESTNPEINRWLMSKLKTLLFDRYIEIKNPGTIEDDKISATVYLNDIDISVYFPEMKDL